jgi:exoribonuclease II
MAFAAIGCGADPGGVVPVSAYGGSHMGLQGKLVEYIEQGKFFCALVLEDQNKRLRVLAHNGREVNLPPSRIVHQSSSGYSPDGGREELIRLLRERGERRQALMAEVDLPAIWELAQESAQAVFSPAFLAELSFGERAGDDQVAALLRCVIDDKLYFKYKEGQVVAHTVEVVEQLRQRQEKERQEAALLTSGARGLLQLGQGEAPGDWPERAECLRLVRDFYLFGKEAPESDLARELLKLARLNRPHDSFHLLVRAGEWEANENIPLLRQELPTEFSPEALAQAGSFPEPDGEELVAVGRRDLRHLELLTIDGESTRDYDDALHLERRGENFLVGIHISDVAHYVHPGDPLYAEALRRTTSIYLPDRQIPMLPPAVSEGICSLIAGRPRAAMSFLVLLSPAGEVLDFDLVRSVITVKRQLSYPAVDGMLATDGELQTLADLSQQLRKRRVEKGAVIMPIPDVDIRPEPEIAIRLADVDTPSRTLIAEFMVLANSLGAQYVADRQVPGLFRSQEPPRKLLVGTPDKDLLVNFLQRRCLSPGKLETKPRPHSGVGVMMYTTVTSPIRRLLDLAMQHQLTGLMRGQGARFTAGEMQELVGIIVAGQGRVGQVRQLRQRYWILKYLEQHQGERFDALVLTWGPKRVQVLLTDFLLEGDLPSTGAMRLQPGETVKIAIGRANALDNDLRLEW